MNKPQGILLLAASLMCALAAHAQTTTDENACQWDHPSIVEDSCAYLSWFDYREWQQLCDEAVMLESDPPQYLCFSCTPCPPVTEPLRDCEPEVEDDCIVPNNPCRLNAKDCFWLPLEEPPNSTEPLFQIAPL